MARPLNPLPRQIKLPWGGVVKVRLATPSECAEENKKANAASKEPLFGWYDGDINTIFIRSTLKPAQKRYVLGHELHHAVIDWVDEMLQLGVMVPTKDIPKK